MTSIDIIRQNIEQRSEATRQHYLQRMQAQADYQKSHAISCSNQAHAIAAASAEEKTRLLDANTKNVAIVTAYNDVLSAHQPYATYPDKIKTILAQFGHTAQVAGGVPAMCDGVTQGQPGMELSLFSRDVIAQATAVGLSHNTFDAVALLGICDKIAPGMLMGALSFGHLPVAFIPSGPMTTGASNEEKVIVRQQFAAGHASEKDLLAMECKAYHSEGTCTFYGTANTNQLVFEAMGLMMPGSAFVPPNTPLREALTEAALKEITQVQNPTPLKDIVDARNIINGLVALLASGGSTNHTIHLIAVARAAGYFVSWEDIDALSKITPLLCRIYPNGSADINSFEQAGAVPAVLRELDKIGLIFPQAKSISGNIAQHVKQPTLAQSPLTFKPVATQNLAVIAQAEKPFLPEGGIKLMQGNLGRGVIKTSALNASELTLTAPVLVFQTQEAVLNAIKTKQITQDCFIAVTHNGPAANGMPELHQLIPSLNNLMAAGLKIVLLTDGRLSGASGKVPAVLHLCPEAAHLGPLAKLKDGDLLSINLSQGQLNSVDDLTERPHKPVATEAQGLFGTQMFDLFRKQVSAADQGASILFDAQPSSEQHSS